MAEYRNSNRILYPLGVTQEEKSAHILVQGHGEEVFLLLYRPGEKKPCEKIPFDPKHRMGDVWSLELDRADLASFEYNFMIDGKIVADPYARILTGREKWADRKRAGKPVQCRVLSEAFDWEDDANPEIPYADTILYKLHVRGFTAHASSNVSARGTYAGIVEKIPYLKDLGITAVELMPVTEFDEVMMSSSGNGFHDAKPEPTGYINYWGYGPSYLYTVKSAYASHGEMSAESEFKTLVKELHRAGIECIPELYFTGKELPGEIVSVLRYWVEEYHVDGFHLLGFPNLLLAAEDPFLKRTKLFAENWNEVMDRRPKKGYITPGDGPVSVAEKNLAEYNMQFMEDMRRFLKGDEGMLQAFEFRNRRNPAEYAVVNYMANTNGFTLMDAVSYDRKHNEKNGWNNTDGDNNGHSWNCGAEGETDDPNVNGLRRRLIKNAFAALLCSRGPAMFFAGDEFCNTQFGNNNAYCQDNIISWLDWSRLEEFKEIHDFVRHMIQFRKEHPILRKMTKPSSCQFPEISVHNGTPFNASTDYKTKLIGIMYAGRNEEDTEDDIVFYCMNAYWEPLVMQLPVLPNGKHWHVDTNTNAEYFDGEDFTAKTELLGVNTIRVPARTTIILVAE